MKKENKSQGKLPGLNDEMLRTPAHDEMILWLLNKENIRKVLPLVDDFLKVKTKSVIVNSRDNRIQNYECSWNRGYDDQVKNPIKYIQNGTIPNFQERCREQMELWWKRIVEIYSNCNTYNLPPRDISIESEVPITIERNFIVGYWDVVILLKDYCYNKYWFVLSWRNVGNNADDGEHEFFERVYIEVKPKIQSFGDTLRQLRTYQNFVPESKGNIYLFTKDLTFKDAFESQGIKVITYPEVASQ